MKYFMIILLILPALIITCVSSGRAVLPPGGLISDNSPLVNRLPAASADSLLMDWNRSLPVNCTLKQRIILKVGGKEYDFNGISAMKQPNLLRITGFGDMGGLLFDFLLDSSGAFTILKKPESMPKNPLINGLQSDLKHLYLPRTGSISAYADSNGALLMIQQENKLSQKARIACGQVLISVSYSGKRQIRTVSYDCSAGLSHARGIFPGKILLTNHLWHYSLEIETHSLRPLSNDSGIFTAE